MEKKYKREYRDFPESGKEKLRNNPSLHRPKSAQHKMRISQGLKKFWNTLEYKPKPPTTMMDLIAED